MIIKSMSRKTDNFFQLLDYINKGSEKDNSPIFHNLKTDEDDLEKITHELKENARYAPRRKNGVVCYHEILSFPALDRAPITPAILEDFARVYLQRRAPTALGYAKAHWDTQHPHIHFCISGNHIKQRTKNRLSRAEFDQVKQDLEQYRAKYYPQLLFAKEPTQDRKTNKPEKQQLLADKIVEIFTDVSHLSEGLAHLAKAHIKPYQRGKTVFYGVIFEGKKYRLSTLGIREWVHDRVKHWEKVEERLRALDAIRQAKEQNKGKLLEREK